MMAVRMLARRTVRMMAMRMLTVRVGMTRRVMRAGDGMGVTKRAVTARTCA